MTHPAGSIGVDDARGAFVGEASPAVKAIVAVRVGVRVDAVAVAVSVAVGVSVIA
jgi:hypothetical protein